MEPLRVENLGTEAVFFTEPYLRILETLCAALDFRTGAGRILPYLVQITGCEAVALRVHDQKDDFPYFAHLGFDPRFVAQESVLCRIGLDGRVIRDAQGVAELECMCGLVLRGRTSPERSFFTEGGSFWTNSTSDLLAGTSDATRGTKTRNTCNAWTYESVALVPMHAGNGIVGLLQANSRQRDRFTPGLIQFLERISRHIGAAIEASWRREELTGMLHEFKERRRGAEALVAMGELASTLAHELKNPLAGMMLSATRLRRALKGQELESVAHHLCSSIGTLNETVTSLTASIRNPRLCRESVRLSEVLESALLLVAPRASAQNVRIVRDFGPEPDRVLADPNFLKRAFLNLLVNALDVMPCSGALWVRTRPLEGGEVEVTIADTGPGVDPNEVERLFEAFTTTKPQGTGLGLGIVRRLLELHSGSVTLRPRASGGTEAVVRLPAEAG